VRRLLLVRHAPTGATRAAAFPLDEALDSRGRAAAAGLAAALPQRCEVLSSPALRCLQTAEAAGLSATIDPRLAECDFGSWAGLTLAQVHDDDSASAEAWMREPDAAPHGGESLRAFAARVAGWLDEQASSDGTAAAITHGGVVKAALVRALGAPLEAFWRIDCAPLSITELHAHDGRWTLTRVNCPPTAPFAEGPAFVDEATTEGTSSVDADAAQRPSGVDGAGVEGRSGVDGAAVEAVR
jgi:broad specificity phosphatase PhoE